MTFFALFLAISSLASAEQPSAPSPIAAPLRELPWGKLNFLHTTDTHGWHGGHLQEAQYSADWGDYISFAHHLHKRADDEGSDLLLVDTGDRVEGNGLYDASDPKGKYALDIVKQQSIDIVTVGNHELYLKNTSIREYESVVPDFKSSYIASNLDIYHPKTGERVALGQRFRKFTTKNQGIRIAAFGFLFNFKGNANNTIVQPVEDTIKEQWFKDAIKDKDVDLFVVAGHVPVKDTPEYDAVYKAIRGANWDTPIAFFGGHTHIRDYRKFDKKAWGIESGRYMETLGFMSISGLSTGKKSEISADATPTYRRMYIDNNLYSLHSHSGTNKSTFDTDLGRNVSKSIAAARKELKLDHAFGCAPQDYWISRAPYPSRDSLLTLIEKEVIPGSFNNTRNPSIVITNTGALRFDIFKGPFTIDSTFLISPFTSGFRTIKNVPYKAASQVLRILNSENRILLSDLSASVANGLEDLSPPFVSASVLSRSEAEKVQSQDIYPSNGQTILGGSGDSKNPQVPGYTTTDDAGTDGDDTIHQTIKFYDVPNCIGANITSTASVSIADEPDKVDLVYNAFVEDWVLLALEYLGEKRQKSDTQVAIDGKTLTDVLRDWVQDNWPCEKDD
ncbi:ser/Thr protein phosphatase family [Zymoseptoria brevis]|uniref:Ser/Thr protein phosphatase family n=1 Tax=Zymoseptoria brevis TaxID=1047168 RepID=A0A0F4G6C0_9PEZI|nr:ser/Thr protein phosphatase family [Zymoseptoria brevis]